MSGIADGSGGSELEGLRVAAEQSGATVVVAGSFLLRGDSLEFQAQLISAAKGRLLSTLALVSGSVDAEGELVAEVGQLVVGLLAANMNPKIYDVYGGMLPPSLDTYREFITGIERFDEATPIAEQLAREFPTNVDYRRYLGTLSARHGETENARRISDSLNELADPYTLGRHTSGRRA